MKNLTEHLYHSLVATSIFVVTIMSVNAQSLSSFRAYHESGLSSGIVDTLSITQIARLNSTDSTIFALFQKANWQANELAVLDSLLQTEFTPLHNACLKYIAGVAYYDFDQLNKETLPIAFLDSVYNEMAFNCQKTKLTSTLYTALSIQYFMNGEKNRALALAHKAYQIESQQAPDLGSYLFNIGYLHAVLGNNDSALYYLHAARKALPALQTIYYLNIHLTTNNALAYVHQKLGNLESAYHYLRQHMGYADKLTQLEPEERRIYASKYINLGAQRLLISMWVMEQRQLLIF